MSSYHVKLMAAGVLLAAGLGVGGGFGWLAPAGAQSPASYPRLTPEERVKQLEDQLDQAKKEVERSRLQRQAGAYATTKWRFEFVPAREVDAEQFVKVLQEREAGGWEYNGQASLKKDGKDTAVWVFRRPAGGRTGDYSTRPETSNPLRLPGSPDAVDMGSTLPPASNGNRNRLDPETNPLDNGKNHPPR